MSYISFIKSQLEAIRGFEQEGFAWRDGYSETFLNMVTRVNEDFGTAINSLPAVLNREVVRSFFHSEKDLYKGFVACMLWGGINATRCAKGHRGDLQTTDAYKAFTFPKDDFNNGRDQRGVVSKLSSIDGSLKEGNTEAAFNSLKNGGENHIPGVGVSFFTKLLYFMAPDTITPEPLIYDKWSTYIHCALLIDDPEKNAFDCYRGVNRDGTLSKVRPEEGLYKDYLDIMNKTAKANGIEDVSRLEAFLFGYALNRRGHEYGKSRRSFLKKYVQDYFKSSNDTDSTTGEKTQTSKSTRHERNNEPTKITPLPSDKKQIRGRKVLFGYFIPFKGKTYYLFIGEKITYKFLVLLTKKGTDRIEDLNLVQELEKKGFGNNKGDYIYKRLEPYDEKDAKQQLDEIAKMMLSNNDGQS